MLKQILLLLTAGCVSCVDPVLPPYLSVQKDRIRKKMQLSLNLGMFERDKHTEDLGTCDPNIVVSDNSAQWIETVRAHVHVCLLCLCSAVFSWLNSSWMILMGLLWTSEVNSIELCDEDDVRHQMNC